ncbi:hypothetical protein C7444_13215 [Sphaerotilus hippei]|uniref:Uncharacterized protein n=1 Tax=Sphaerotilus hippei TaxID=744406 RepID=A0A318GTW5_9BURK|nr:hypothetical protein [Sphaerotilus hippei]PXW91571.1 hypothetical protein C7444_13215 [Sphaerotilus hippei]
MQTLDDMLSLHLLTPAQHSDIRAWTRWAKTPEKILEMPPHLWRALELASVLMDVEMDERSP